MNKIILAAIACLACIYGHSQDKDKYAYKPFPIFKTPTQVVIAGDVNAFSYTNYSGKDVKKETYKNANAKPEYLVYELFQAMKTKKIGTIEKLYDTTFKKERFDVEEMAAFTKPYTDIKYVSKFRSGDLVVMRYDFISATDTYPYFAMIQQSGGNYYLTTNINLSDPFNLIGSLSPVNITQKTEKPFATTGMTGFYFLRHADTVAFAYEKPAADHTTLYLTLERFSDNGASPEKEFIAALQKAATSSDSAALKNMLSKEAQGMLGSEYYGNYFMAEIRKIFQGYAMITPVAAVSTSDGKVLYFRYTNPGESTHLSSIILKKENNRYSLSLKVKDDVLNNVLQNLYVKEAIHTYLKRSM